MTTEPGDFEHDVTLLDRYLAYSTELIRLALLGIGAIGYLITTHPFSEQAKAVRSTLWLALIAFMVSTAAGLFHRYVAPDSLGDHLELLRKPEHPKTNEFKMRRDRKFTLSGQLLALSAICLCVGAGAAAYAFARSI
jgi:hypothetical protein